MDIRMPELGGIEATRRITTERPDIKSADKLAEAVRVVAAGDALLAPGITRRLIGGFSRVCPN